VVILMQENRSFDHYFGTLSGVRGFSDPAVLQQTVGGVTYPVFDQFGFQPGTGVDASGYHPGLAERAVTGGAGNPANCL
jgi:phospholipase C